MILIFDKRGYYDGLMGFVWRLVFLGYNLIYLIIC